MSERRVPCSSARGRVGPPALLSGASLVAGVSAVSLCSAPLTTAHRMLGAGVGWRALPLDLAVACLAAGALLGCTLWLVAVTLATVVEVFTGASWAFARAVTPHVVRRGVVVLCGAAIGGAGVVGQASAATDHASVEGPHAASSASPAGPVSLDGLPLPDRPVGEAARRPTPASKQQEREPHHTDVIASSAAQRGLGAGLRAAPATAERGSRGVHRVRPGDSLWSIAESLLPVADVAEVDRCWRRIYRTNRAAVGDDPDLIVPGTTLRLPHCPGASGSGDPHERGTSSHRKDAS